MPPEAIQKDAASIRLEIRTHKAHLESLERTYHLCGGDDYLRHWITASVEPAVSKILDVIETKEYIGITTAEVKELASMTSVANNIYPRRPRGPLNASTSSTDKVN